METPSTSTNTQVNNKVPEGTQVKGLENVYLTAELSTIHSNKTNKDYQVIQLKFNLDGRPYEKALFPSNQERFIFGIM